MKIAIYTDATKITRSGNWVTASRWAKLLQSAGHSVRLLHKTEQVKRSGADVLIALHARRSATAVFEFKKQFPDGQAIVALTGTDIYGDLSPNRTRKSKTAIRALDACDQLILLQPLMKRLLTNAWKRKSTVVMMDVAVRAGMPSRIHDFSERDLKACVVGHLRYEKDALRAAMAVRELPPKIRVSVTQFGKALNDSFQTRAQREHTNNANWSWAGSVAASGVAAAMRKSDLLINSSRSEGAPNVLFEAMSFGLPMLVSKIDGHVGVLGSAYPGYFRVGDTKELTQLLCRCVTDSGFHRKLTDAVMQKAKTYRPGQELAFLQKAIARASS